MWLLNLIIQGLAVYTSSPIFVAFLDYNNTNQSVMLRAGENCVDIETLEDTRVEETERFHAYLAIATTTGAKVLHTCYTFTILDNEGE